MLVVSAAETHMENSMEAVEIGVSKHLGVHVFVFGWSLHYKNNGLRGPHW